MRTGNLDDDPDEDSDGDASAPASASLRSALDAEPGVERGGDDEFGRLDDAEEDAGDDEGGHEAVRAPAPDDETRGLPRLRDARPTRGPGAAPRHVPVVLDLALLADPVQDPDGHQTEWTRFFRGFHDRLLDFFGYAVPDVDGREDLVQEIFIKAYAANVISGYPLQSSGAAWSWLTMIGKNLLRDRHDSDAVTRRKLDRHGEHALVEEELQQHAADVLERLASDPFEDGAWGVDHDTFVERLERLTDEDRRLLHLRFWRDMEWRDVAAAMGKSSEAVRKQFSRMGKFLRDG